MKLNTTWKAVLLAVASVAATNFAQWVWTTGRAAAVASITAGKADETAVSDLKEANDKAHKEITTELNSLRTEQQTQGRLMKRVARKLKVEE